MAIRFLFYTDNIITQNKTNIQNFIFKIYIKLPNAQKTPYFTMLVFDN